MNIADKKKLLKRKAELQKTLENLQRKDNNPGVNDREVQIQNTEHSLKLVAETMIRLEEDLYDYSLLCDDEIDRRILMKYPEKTTCKSCE